jgi:hypothetical protein
MQDIRVYLVNVEFTNNLSDEDFVKEAELTGDVHTLKGFEHRLNMGWIDLEDKYIRFININSISQ